MDLAPFSKTEYIIIPQVSIVKIIYHGREPFVSKPEVVPMAKQGQTVDVGIAHRGDTEYLKSIPDGSENNNLGNLPSVSPET